MSYFSGNEIVDIDDEQNDILFYNDYESIPDSRKSCENLRINFCSDEPSPASGDQGASSSSTRGSRRRIAKVLAEARASLKDPSRPFTPAALDMRTSIDMNAASSRPWQSSIAFERAAEIDEDAAQAVSKRNGGSNAIHSLLSENLRKSCRSTEIENVSSINRQKVPKHYQQIQLSIADLRDTLKAVESHLVTLTSMTPSAYSDIGDAKTDELLLSMGPPINKIAKFLKIEASLEQEIQRDINAVIGDLAAALLQLLRSQSRPCGKETKSMCCRYLLRLNLARVNRCYSCTSISNSSATKVVQHPIPVDVASAIQATTRIMYKTTLSLHATFDHADLNVSDVSELGEEAGAGEEGGGALLLGGAEHLLEVLLVVWQRLPGDVKRELETGHRQVLLLRDQGLSADPTLAKSQEGTRENGFLILLESGLFAAGVLRMLSLEPTSRRRLLHLGALANMSSGLSAVIGVFEDLLFDKERREPCVDTSSKAFVRIGYVVDKLRQVLVQLLGAYRNFSLDPDCRKEMLSSRAVCALCALVGYFGTSHDLVLNCVRVTAKLSLLEPFRSQINASAENIKSLVGVITREGDAQAAARRGAKWPHENTWALLSRAAFSLGNLTTSNQANRRIIALDCRGLGHIIVLLRACALLLGTEAEVLDATIKLLRLLANVCIDSAIGTKVGAKHHALELLQQLLRSLLAAEAPDSSQEELLLNVVACATNISFYACRHAQAAPADNPGRGQVDRLETSLVLLARSLSHCLFSENEEVVLEAARALGNLTRSPPALLALCDIRAFEALVLLLSHPSEDIVTASTGALVNISSDAFSRVYLVKLDYLLPHLERALRASSLRNLQLSSLICQVVFNLLLHDDCARDGPALLRALPPLLDALAELADCTEDMDGHCGGGYYATFTAVAKAVLTASERIL